MALSCYAGLKEKWTNALEWVETQAKTNRYLYGAGGLALLVVAVALAALVFFGVSLAFTTIDKYIGGLSLLGALVIAIPILVPLGCFGGAILYAAIRHSEEEMQANSIEYRL